MSERKSWDAYFMELAKQVASRSTCTRRRVGAVATNKHHRILGTGYNGAPSGLKHCTKESCIRELLMIPSGTQLDLCKAIHAEANIVLQLGERLTDATLYCTTQPCTSCLKLLMGAGIHRLVWEEFYPDKYSHALMFEYGIPFIRNGLVNLVRRYRQLECTCMEFDVKEFLAFQEYSKTKNLDASHLAKEILPVMLAIGDKDVDLLMDFINK